MFQMMFYVGLVLALFFLVVSVILFVKNDVAKLMGDITGWNAKREIRKLRIKGAEDKSKEEAIHSATSGVLVQNVAVTEPVKLDPSIENVFEVEEQVMVFASEVSGGMSKRVDMQLADDEETTLLADGEEETTVLEEVTTKLSMKDEEETTLLSTD